MYRSFSPALVSAGYHTMPLSTCSSEPRQLTGTVAATLVGLLFVAVTVGTGLSTSRIVHGTRGFLTPTLIHLGSVLFQTLAVLAPWPSAWPIGIILGPGELKA